MGSPLEIAAEILNRLVAAGLVTRERADAELTAAREKLNRATKADLQRLQEERDMFLLSHR